MQSMHTPEIKKKLGLIRMVLYQDSTVVAAELHFVLISTEKK